METKKYYIAYMDILGYSDYIEKHPKKVNEFLSIITTAIEKIKNNVESLTNIGKDGFKVDINIKLFRITCCFVWNKERAKMK